MQAPYSRFKEIKSNFRIKNKESNVLGGNFSNRDNVRAPILYENLFRHSFPTFFRNYHPLLSYLLFSTRKRFRKIFNESFGELSSLASISPSDFHKQLLNILVTCLCICVVAGPNSKMRGECFTS